jgi:hypothetical protein
VRVFVAAGEFEDEIRRVPAIGIVVEGYDEKAAAHRALLPLRPEAVMVDHRNVGAKPWFAQAATISSTSVRASRASPAAESQIV